VIIAPRVCQGGRRPPAPPRRPIRHPTAGAPGSAQCGRGTPHTPTRGAQGSGRGFGGGGFLVKCLFCAGGGPAGKPTPAQAGVPAPGPAEGWLPAAARPSPRFDETSDFPACPWPLSSLPPLPSLRRRAPLPFCHCHRQRLMGCVVRILGPAAASARREQGARASAARAVSSALPRRSLGAPLPLPACRQPGLRRAPRAPPAGTAPRRALPK